MAALGDQKVGDFDPARGGDFARPTGRNETVVLANPLGAEISGCPLICNLPLDQLHGKPRPSEAVAKRQTGFDEDQKAVVSVIGETDFPRRRIAVPNKFVDIVGVHAAKGLFA
jgi:hypothetical protein